MSNEGRIQARQLSNNQLRQRIKKIDGPGSEIDADTVDGSHAEEFLRVTTPRFHRLENLMRIR